MPLKARSSSYSEAPCISSVTNHLFDSQAFNRHPTCEKTTELSAAARYKQGIMSVIFTCEVC